MSSTPSPFMRAKVVLDNVQKTESWSGEGLAFRAVCKSDGYGPEGLDENNTYATYTPMLDLKMSVTNPALLNRLARGDEFYVDFHLIPKVVKVS